MTMASQGEDLRVILVGKPGVGKSKLGNVLLKKSVFHVPSTADYETPTCRVGERPLDNQGKLLVVDTPGGFDQATTNKEGLIEVIKCMLLASPGPHAFILVLPMRKYTREDLDTMQFLKQAFGQRITNYINIVFTFNDSCQVPGSKIKNVNDFVDTATPDLKQIIKECNNRYTAIDSLNPRDEVDSIINVVKQTRAKNNNACFSEQMFKISQQLIDEKMEKSGKSQIKIRKDIEDEENLDLWIPEFRKFLKSIPEYFKGLF